MKRGAGTPDLRLERLPARSLLSTGQMALDVWRGVKNARGHPTRTLLPHPGGDSVKALPPLPFPPGTGGSRREVFSSHGGPCVFILKGVGGETVGMRPRPHGVTERPLSVYTLAAARSHKHSQCCCSLQPGTHDEAAVCVCGGVCVEERETEKERERSKERGGEAL